jgi:spermidine synthase
MKITSSLEFPVLLAMFVVSGCSALIYEIVWFQLLELVIGSSAVSLAILLGAFMGGMCLGSLVLPRVLPLRQHPLRLFAFLELGVGIFGLLVFFGIPYAGGLYVAVGGAGFQGVLVRGVICGICLLPPTLLMGATLPIIARQAETTPKGISWIGFLYGGNIGGAVLGCLLAGFYLLRVHDMSVATYVAASANFAVAASAFLLARTTPHRSFEQRMDDSVAVSGKADWAVYAAIALSGLCALGAEVVWTRVLSLILGATVYTFAIILAVFLLGLGIGGSLGSALSRRSSQPWRDLGFCQFLLTGAIAWSAYWTTRSFPYWAFDPALSTPWFNFQVDVFRCVLAVLPAACLWGASFPLALATARGGGQDPARLVGGLYAANTLGGILGSIGFSLVIIAAFGTQRAQQALIGLSAAAGLLMLGPAAWPTHRNFKWQTTAVVLAASILAVMLAFTVSPVPPSLIAYGRYLTRTLAIVDAKTKAPFVPEILYVGEGLNSSVAVSQIPDYMQGMNALLAGRETAGGFRSFHVSGKVEASNLPDDMRLQRMLGHLSALHHEEPRSVLVVGFGAGVTAGSFILHPSVRRIVICEIEPRIPRFISQYFVKENYDVLRDPRVEVVYDDARHYILTTQEKFDIITSDPIHPWVKGSAALYTREYFELIKQRLNPGGVISQWAPLYESTEEAVKSEIATFSEAFPNGTIWSNAFVGSYDFVLIGKNGVPAINLDEFSRRLNRPDHQAVAGSLREVGFASVLDLLATYAGRLADLAPWLASAEINRDRNLRLQYLAGMGLNVSRDATIFNAILAYRRFSNDLFSGSDELKQSLRNAIARSEPAQ